MPKLSAVYFVHKIFRIFEYFEFHCRIHLSNVLANINSPMAPIQGAFVSLSYVLFQAFLLDKSDKERQLGCLRKITEQSYLNSLTLAQRQQKTKLN